MDEVLVLAGAMGLTSALAFGINFLISKGVGKPSDGVLKGVAFVISLGAAYLIAQPAIPSFEGDPVQFGLVLTAFGTLIFKGAEQIYDRVLKSLLSKIRLSYI